MDRTINMPSRRLHLIFDEYLKDRGIINGYTYANTVHDRMDRDASFWGPDHRYIDFYHAEEGIRDWLSSFQHLAYQETLTDYLRVCLGHMCLDIVHSKGEWYDEYDLMKRACRSFIGRGYNRKYFRRR